MLTLAVIGLPILVVLVCAFLLDRKARRRGDALRSTDQIQSSIRNARSEVRAWGRFKRANRDAPGKWM